MSCSSSISAAQACIEDVVGLCTATVATLLLSYMSMLYTGSICKSVVATSRCICIWLFLLDFGLCVKAEYSIWWFSGVVSGVALSQL